MGKSGKEWQGLGEGGVEVGGGGGGGMHMEEEKVVAVTTVVTSRCVVWCMCKCASLRACLRVCQSMSVCA